MARHVSIVWCVCVKLSSSLGLRSPPASLVWVTETRRVCFPVAPPESRLLFLPPDVRARAVSGRGLADYGTRVSSVLAEIATLPFVL
jgi:hypothetical protein